MVKLFHPKGGYPTDSGARGEARPQNNREPGPQPEREQKESQRQELKPPKQVNLQFLDDTWERLLNALERLEQVTEGFKNISAARLDDHPDKDTIKEGEVDVRSEVHLQIKCVQRVVHPVREDATWMVKDFLGWFGGREAESRPLAPTDEYAIPVLQCLLGVPYTLPDLPASGPLTQTEMMRTMEIVGASLIKTDQIEKTFLEDTERMATRHLHSRGTVELGLQRMQRIQDPWVQKFLPKAKEVFESKE